jgi:hypothetical protein
MPGRYPQIDTVQFRRKLDNPKRNILLAAGQGNITKGFENILAIYQHLHSIGYRVDNPLDQIALVTIESVDKQAAQIKMNQ